MHNLDRTELKKATPPPPFLIKKNNLNKYAMHYLWGLLVNTSKKKLSAARLFDLKK
ncbi:hypothetical protein A33I_11230 [Alkalihalophilus marmarensis DSM 21297]|jgi:hypothetical protein|uniref:Uncharacterized protein n=1 Tax=Alkalihalophilus marmarensis DSM 21297 TaxID=1188261 RepID=U6SRM9_9BACI|nr:hypothetical protein A33I_11230 [Alkalihalophilus marmarensis DSM 21297]